MSDVVQQGDFAVRINTPYGYSTKIPNSYRPFFQLKDGATYSIVLANDGPTKADAQVFVDGQDCGLFRIEAHSNNIVEHPQFINKKFTFKSAKNFAESSYEGNEEPQNGKISVLFTPEKNSKSNPPTTAIPYEVRESNTKLEGQSGYTPDVNYSLYDAGTTVLGQEGIPYTAMVAPITDIDNGRIAIVDAWLVVKK